MASTPMATQPALARRIRDALFVGAVVFLAAFGAGWLVGGFSITNFATCIAFAVIAGGYSFFSKPKSKTEPAKPS